MSKLFLTREESENPSSFQVSGHLYEYAQKKLSGEQNHKIEQIIHKDLNLYKEHQYLTKSLDYLQNLSKITVSAETLQEIIEPTTYFELLKKASGVDKWDNRLKRTVEFLVTVLIMTGLFFVIPWNRLLKLRFTPKPDFVLERVEHVKSQEAPTEKKTETNPSQE